PPPPRRARAPRTTQNSCTPPAPPHTPPAIKPPPPRRTEVQKYLAAKFEATIRVKPEEVTAALSAPERATAGTIQQRIAALNKGRRSLDKIQALYDVGPPPRTYLLKRGNHERPGEEVEWGFPTVLSDPPRSDSPSPPSDGGEGKKRGTRRPVGPTSGRRTALAAWLTEPNSRASALLSRVMVNRLWQHLFGRGLVPTPENFGLSGEPPTHPELLDWLSSEFVRGGWRIKPMLKLMMTST